MMLHPEFEWSVDLMAKRLNLGRTRFQTLYKETFGISPIDDVINARIRLSNDTGQFQKMWTADLML